MKKHLTPVDMTGLGAFLQNRITGKFARNMGGSSAISDGISCDSFCVFKTEYIGLRLISQFSIWT